jgi:hypothetical protein
MATHALDDFLVWIRAARSELIGHHDEPIGDRGVIYAPVMYEGCPPIRFQTHSPSRWYMLYRDFLDRLKVLNPDLYLRFAATALRTVGELDAAMGLVERDLLTPVEETNEEQDSVKGPFGFQPPPKDRGAFL